MSLKSTSVGKHATIISTCCFKNNELLSQNSKTHETTQLMVLCSLAFIDNMLDPMIVCI